MQENGKSEVRESGNRVSNDAIMMDVSTDKYGEDNNTLSREEGSMVSNLPLLFANGYPTSLEKITMVYYITCNPFFCLKITAFVITKCLVI